jgi:hypothetical protein
MGIGNSRLCADVAERLLLAFNGLENDLQLQISTRGARLGVSFEHAEGFKSLHPSAAMFRRLILDTGHDRGVPTVGGRKPSTRS